MIISRSLAAKRLTTVSRVPALPGSAVTGMYLPSRAGVGPDGATSPRDIAAMPLTRAALHIDLGKISARQLDTSR